MQDWLNVFGQFDPTHVLGAKTNGMYLQTSDKSLVVRLCFSVLARRSDNYLKVSILSAGTFFGAPCI
jgi:hypothetical protein